MSKQTVPAIPAKTHSLQPPYPEAHHYHNGTQWVVASGMYHLIDGNGTVITTFQTMEDIPTHEFICSCCNDASLPHPPPDYFIHPLVFWYDEEIDDKTYQCIPA